MGDWVCIPVREGFEISDADLLHQVRIRAQDVRAGALEILHDRSIVFRPFARCLNDMLWQHLQGDTDQVIMLHVRHWRAACGFTSLACMGNQGNFGPEQDSGRC